MFSFVKGKSSGIILNMKKFNFSKYANSIGATMLEFCLTFLFLLMVIGLIVEGGLAIWRHSMLTETLALTAVDRSIHLERNRGLAKDFSSTVCEAGTCDLTACAKDLIFLRISSLTGIDVNSLQVTIDEPNNLLQDYKLELTMTANWDTPCYLCGLFGKSSLPMSAIAYAPLEASKTEGLLRCPGGFQ